MAENQRTQARYAYPKYKVFIFGIDVTADVTEVSSTWHDGKAPNTCVIKLQSPQNRYIVTARDVVEYGINRARLLSPRYLAEAYGLDASDPTEAELLDKQVQSISKETAEAAVVKFRLPWLDETDRPFEVDLSSVYAIDPIKKSIIDAKSRIEQAFSTSLRKDLTDKPLPITDFSNIFADQQSIPRYPLYEGSPVFHPNDPIRVFMRDPFDPARWYHFFAGFVSDMVEQYGSNNEQELVITSEDPTKLFRYTRIFFNPGILDAKSVVQSEDLRVQSFNVHYFKGFDLAEILFTSIFGPDMVGASEAVRQEAGATPTGEKYKLNTRLRGIGHFSYDGSGVFTFGPPGNSSVNPEPNDIRNRKTTLYSTKKPVNLKSLAEWQYLIDHEVQPEDLYSMSSDPSINITSGANIDVIAKRDADGLIDIEWVVDYIGSNPDKYLVDGGRLMVLLPNSLSPGANVVAVNDIIGSYPLNSEWQSVAEILYDVVDRMLFTMYASPRGDIIIEPQLYDLMPHQFGMNKMMKLDISGSVLFNYDYGPYSLGGSITDSVFRSKPRGPFGANYVIRNRDTISIESAFTDEKVHTLAVISKQLFSGWESLPNSDIIGDLVVVSRPDLIPIYGVRQVPITHRNYVSTHEGAAYYANVVLNQLNSDAHTISISIDSNIKIYPNRPVYIEKLNCIATVRSVSNSIQWGARGSMGTNVELSNVRVWSGKVDGDNVPIYNTIGGAGYNPLDFSILFGLKQKQAK